MGKDSQDTRRLSRMSQSDVAYHARSILTYVSTHNAVAVFSDFYSFSRTIDELVFKPVVSICPLTANDCPNLHLVAVTQHGVRFYFSTVPLMQQQNVNVPNDSVKPQGLYLLHARLPPGYTPNATIGKPKLIHSAFHSNGTMLMVSTPQQDQDVLWSLSAVRYQRPCAKREFLL